MGLLGDPVAHSRSPAMHNAAFAALGLDWVFVPFPAPAGHGRAAVRAALDLGIAGLNVTMPHKADAAAACDELVSDAEQLRAVNTVVVADAGRLAGHNTDGAGFLAALADEEVDVAGSRVLVLGAGGAARAIVLALGGVGASVTVAARRLEAAREAAGLADGNAVELADAPVEECEVLVNATPVGMHGEPPPIDATRLRPGQFVYDTVYPAETPLLAAARARGIACAGGIGMLVHQGAAAFRLWTGRDAPVDVMRAAAVSP
ncbi:MAG TPA: shikimate dehydrogenase [Acidimicrobiia bacterium]|nr:shikimate dehydrogenase [Acidimicrobiia bacterium]